MYGNITFTGLSNRNRRKLNSIRRHALEFGEYEITLREVIFSVLIVGVLFAIGFLISGYVENSVNADLLKYRQAAQIDLSESQFRQAMKTDIGNAFVFGKFETLDPVSYSHLDGKHLKIVANHQRYTMHTRVVHYTTGSGKNKTTHTRIEHYWTWDTIKTDVVHANRVRFLNVDFPYSKFNYNDVRSGGKVVGTGHNLRIVFDYYPITFNATIFSELKDNTISNNTPLFQDKSIFDTYDCLTTSHAVMLFWIGWSILICVCVYGFYYIDNNWLED